jgi:uncharacterized Zn finger protein (UPF0148 family)
MTDQRCDDCGTALRELREDRTGDFLCLGCYLRAGLRRRSLALRHS